MSWLPYLIVLSVVALVRSYVRRALGTPTCIGDEIQYVGCGAQPDPYAPTLFLRVPLMAWLSISDPSEASIVTS